MSPRILNRALASGLLCAAAIAAFAPGCSGGGGGASALPRPIGSASSTPSATASAAIDPIKHIVIIIQENRSFNNLFLGFPGANTSNTGPMSNGVVVTMSPEPLETKPDLGHGHKAFEAAYDHGKMDGFNNEGGWAGVQPASYPYAYVPRAEIQQYWTLAQTYGLGDMFFQSNSGPSYPAHQYLIAGTSDFAAMNPNYSAIWGCDSKAGTTVQVLNGAGQLEPGPFPCFDYETIADLLDQSGHTWRFYAHAKTQVFSAYDAVRHIRNSTDWSNNVIAPASNFITDVQAGHLADVTWITPYFQTSDHPGLGTKGGPAWVASLVNAVGTSQFWNSTAIFITWDDWGGFYDPATPPQLDVMGLGFRVPLIVVSPYAKPSHVSHVTDEFGSILRYTENTFNLPSLGTVDARADALSDYFNYAQAPLPYHTVAPAMTARQAIEREISAPPDDDY